jgi:hypothetical protein
MVKFPKQDRKEYMLRTQDHPKEFMVVQSLPQYGHKRKSTIGTFYMNWPTFGSSNFCMTKIDKAISFKKFLFLTTNEIRGFDISMKYFNLMKIT